MRRMRFGAVRRAVVHLSESMKDVVEGGNRMTTAHDVHDLQIRVPGLGGLVHDHVLGPFLFLWLSGWYERISLCRVICTCTVEMSYCFEQWKRWWKSK